MCFLRSQKTFFFFQENIIDRPGIIFIIFSTIFKIDLRNFQQNPMYYILRFDLTFSTRTIYNYTNYTKGEKVTTCYFFHYNCVQNTIRYCFKIVNENSPPLFDSRYSDISLINTQGYPKWTWFPVIILIPRFNIKLSSNLELKTIKSLRKRFHLHVRSTKLPYHKPKIN